MTAAFKIIGISTRTTNQNNQSAADLGKLWAQFYAENIFEKIPNKVSTDIITIYTDYVSNYTDAYTTIIGVPVSTFEHIPDGLIGREFEAENFQQFTAKGEMPGAVVNTWMGIWKRDSELNRKYTYDLEVYGAKSQDGENAEVEIFIAVK
ncbi:GyrI-like domain-containing protein [Pedobacter miscanthi]|uniref:AraC family transcriptional regulator n=1 Tax=Pedobacter miscanthi TaxID=2259170 RepID=A0A366KRJ0_9SPHI|nr:GyrI-like domain-containing protein [Pedobacter miscanthi]RBQ04255.1 AraC family transcriptional regulator [Pedobacter miscanthi]